MPERNCRAGRISPVSTIHSPTKARSFIPGSIPRTVKKNPDAERTYATVYEGKVVVFARKEIAPDAGRWMFLSGAKPGLKKSGACFPKPDAESTLTVIQAAGPEV